MTIRAAKTPPSRILVVDDDALLRRQLGLQLERLGYHVASASSGEEALDTLRDGSGFSAIVSDVHMPTGDGIELLRKIRGIDHHVPVLLLTGEPTMDTAIDAVALGAFRYLRKPVDVRELHNLLEDAVRQHRVMKRSGVTDNADFEGTEGERLFEDILDTLFMAYQPLVVSEPHQQPIVFGVEALLRATHPRYKHPGQLIGAAEALDRLDDLGVVVRSSIRADLPRLPECWKIFINLHPLELGGTALLQCAAQFPDPERVVFEITERARLREVDDPREAIDALRALGFAIAVDDLGEGYSSVTSLTLLEPEYVKLDMSLIRDIHTDRRRKTMVGGLVAVCHSMGAQVVAEGVETADELHALHHLETDLLQGYHFARPMPVDQLLATPLAARFRAAGPPRSLTPTLATAH